MTVIDADQQALGHAALMEQRRLHLERMDREIAEQTAAGVTVQYDR
jgi:hypothetical protein